MPETNELQLLTPGEQFWHDKVTAAIKAIKAVVGGVN